MSVGFIGLWLFALPVCLSCLVFFFFAAEQRPVAKSGNPNLLGTARVLHQPVLTPAFIPKAKLTYHLHTYPRLPSLFPSRCQRRATLTSLRHLHCYAVWNCPVLFRSAPLCPFAPSHPPVPGLFHVSSTYIHAPAAWMIILHNQPTPRRPALPKVEASPAGEA